MEFGNEKKTKFEISVESNNFIVVLFSIREEIAIFVTGKIFSKYSKFSNISIFQNFQIFFFLQNGVKE